MAVETVHAVCPHDCYDACGLKVTAEDGRVTAIKGDPNHPITRGFLCFKVNHYRDRLYHPDRVTTPLRRVGAKGSGEFEPVSWEQALAEVGGQLQRIMAEWGGEAVLPYTFAGNEGILSHVMAHRFFTLIGASRLDRTICTAAADAALKWVYGTDLGPDPETLPRARLVLLWGSNPLATNIHAVPLLDEARQNGAVIWTIDPLKTATATRFDHHVALKPDSDYALAMGLSRELIHRGAVDQDFIARYVTGYENFRGLAEPWTRARTLAATGVSEAQFDQLCEVLATARPALFRTGWGVQRHRDGAHIIWAVSALSLILGTPRHVGGGHLSSNAGAFLLNRRGLYHIQDAPARPARLVNMVQLGDALTELTDPPIRALIVYQSNPAATAPNQSRVLEGLKRDDLLVVVHEQMLTDTTRYADWVFPAAMSVESLDLYVSYWHRYVQLNRPAAPPLGESVSNTEFFRRLGRALGLNHPALNDSDETLIRTALTTSEAWMDGITWDSLHQNPVQKVRLAMESRPFVDTPIGAKGGRLCIEPLPLPSSAAGPILPPNVFRLLSPSRRETIKSSFGNVESVVKAGEPELLMHPQDANRLGLADGRWVIVSNDLGETRMRVKRSDVAQPGILVSYAVRWNRAADGTNVNQLTSTRLSDVGGGATFYDVQVRVRP